MSHTHSDDAILKHLQAGNTLTPASAMSLFGVAAMHSAAARLREQGYNIICKMRSENGRKFGEYRLTGESWTALLQQSTVKSAGLPVAPVSVDLGLCSPVFQQVAHPNAAQPLRSNSRVTEDSFPRAGEPSGAVAAEVIHLNGKPHEVVFDGVSAYDGTRYCSVERI